MSPHEIWVGWSTTVTNYNPTNLVFCCQSHSTNPPYHLLNTTHKKYAMRQSFIEDNARKEHKVLSYSLRFHGSKRHTVSNLRLILPVSTQYRLSSYLTVGVRRMVYVQRRKSTRNACWFVLQRETSVQYWFMAVDQRIDYGLKESDLKLHFDTFQRIWKRRKWAYKKFSISEYRHVKCVNKWNRETQKTWEKIRCSWNFMWVWR
jgi:hypothetical protein